MDAINSLKIATLVLFAFTLVQYLLYFYRQTLINRRLNFITNSLLTLSFTAYIFILAAGRARCPMGSMDEAVLFMAWFLTIFFLVLDLSLGRKSIGIFIIPFAFTGFIISFFMDSSSVPQDYVNPLFPLHVSLILFSYVMFFLVVVLTLIYGLSLKDIKNIKDGFFFKRVPPLATLDRYIHIFLAAGNIVLPIGTLFGIIWARQSNITDPTLTLKLGTTAMVWLVFLTLLAVRIRKGGSYRWNSTLALLGIFFLMATFLIGRHGF